MRYDFVYNQLSYETRPSSLSFENKGRYRAQSLTPLHPQTSQSQWHDYESAQLVQGLLHGHFYQR